MAIGGKGRGPRTRKASPWAEKKVWLPLRQRALAPAREKGGRAFCHRGAPALVGKWAESTRPGRGGGRGKISSGREKKNHVRRWGGRLGGGVYWWRTERDGVGSPGETKGLAGGCWCRLTRTAEGRKARAQLLSWLKNFMIVQEKRTIHALMRGMLREFAVKKGGKRTGHFMRRYFFKKRDRAHDSRDF